MYKLTNRSGNVFFNESDHFQQNKNKYNNKTNKKYVDVADEQ